jgi:hypothetical protein
VATESPATVASIVAPGSTAPEVSFTAPVMSTFWADAAAAQLMMRVIVKRQSPSWRRERMSSSTPLTRW